MMAVVKVTIKSTPHPDPKRLTDLWSHIVLDELLTKERESEAKPDEH